MPKPVFRKQPAVAKLPAHFVAGSTTNEQLTDTRSQAAEANALRERDEFESGFRCSSNGNSTRLWEGLRLTVFKRGRQYCWVCNSDGEDSTFSEDRYETEKDAIGDLARYLGVGQL